MPKLVVSEDYQLQGCESRDRVLGYVATFNDAEIVHHCIAALKAQTFPVAGILVVDNDSSDGLNEVSLADGVDFIRHHVNLGTSGAAFTALEYALQHGFDWVWVFDADSVPEPDALEVILEFNRTLSAQDRDRVFFIGSLPVDAPSGFRQHGVAFGPRGLLRVAPEDTFSAYRCDATMWTGTLYRMAAVREVGLPNSDYVLDLGDIAYGYMGYLRGYESYIHQSSVVNHNLHAIARINRFHLGPISVNVHTSPPIRRYYTYRNTLYFWLREYRGPRTPRALLPPLAGLAKSFFKSVLFPGTRAGELSASVRGIWDGLRGRFGLEPRYNRSAAARTEGKK